MTEPEEREVRWLCLGKRLSAKGDKLVTYFRDDEGEEYAYGKVTGQPGCWYDLTIRGESTVMGSARFVGMHETRELLAQLQATQRAEDTLLEVRRLEKRAGETAALKAAIEPVAELYSRITGYDRQGAFLSVMTVMVCERAAALRRLRRKESK